MHSADKRFPTRSHFSLEAARRRTPTKRLAFALLCIAFTTFAMSGRSARGAGLLVADNGNGGVLAIKEHTVHVTINNGIAVTHVTQVFQNTENRQVEALYTFPVPKGASVCNFSMWINGKEMIGEVVEKERARQIYDSYKRVKRDPGILEQTDFRTFEMRIFPIGALAEEKVQISYYQELDFDHDWATYVYPLATATRGGINSKTEGKFAFSVDAKSQVPITAMESPSHPKDFAIAKQTDNYYQASLENKTGDLSRDVVLAYHLSRPNTGLDLVASRQGTENGYFYLTLTAGEELAKKDTGMDYVFLLDISGSMNDDGKLELSRKSLHAFINALGKDDRFELMSFNVQPTTLFRSVMPADDAHKKQAEDFLQAQEARGGTVLNPAITTAYKYVEKERPLNVVILSDGMTEQTSRPELISLIRERPAGARVFCIGVGNDVDRSLLEQIAHDSGGLASFLSSEDNFDRQAAAFRRKLMHPVLADVKLQWDGAAAYDMEPQKLPNLYYGMPVRCYGRYKQPGATKVTISGTVDGKPVTQAVSFDLPKEDDTQPEIERMWAWHRIDSLLKQADAGGSRSAVASEVVRLGEAYSIATEFTSFIVLENDSEFQRWSIARRNEFRLARDRAAEQQLATQLQTLRNKAAADLGPAPAATPAQPLAAPAGQPVLSDPSSSQNNVAPDTNAPGNAAPRTAPGSPSVRTNHDIDLGGPGGGGGAIDPITGVLVIGLAAAAAGSYIARRRSVA